MADATEAIYLCTGKEKRPDRPWMATFELVGPFSTPFLTVAARLSRFSIQTTDEQYIIGRRYCLSLTEVEIVNV